MANTAVVYDRRYEDKELNFEASGALWKASLVMRDRETDSWWSIMSSDAIGGPMAGAELVELPYGEKATWADWRAKHPDTLVLSVGGREHLEHDPYRDYFASDGTFRGLEIRDRRLEPKAPIFSFFLASQAYAAPHSAFEGGRLFEVDGGTRLLLYRGDGASMFASSSAWIVPADTGGSTAELLDQARAGAGGFEPLGGIDTFWYNWIAINEGSKLLR